MSGTVDPPGQSPGRWQAQTGEVLDAAPGSIPGSSPGTGTGSPAAGAGEPRMPREIAGAVIKVMKGVTQLGFDEKNAHGGYSYASIDKFLDALRPLMAASGIFATIEETEIAYINSAPSHEGKVTRWMTARYEVFLYHESGVGWGPLKRSLAIPMTGPQTFGSAESYVQKRLLRALFMVPTGDRDADETAQSVPPPATRAKPAVAPITNLRARQLAVGIRNNIAEAKMVDDLNHTGLFNPAHEKEIKAQTGGDVVWGDLLRRDADRRLDLAQPSGTPLEDFDP